MKNVLITGMSGLIGGLLRRRLEEVGGYRLRALNRRPVEGVECVQADIADFDAIRPAFDGIEVVVHLSANVEVNDWEGQLSGNLIGLYNVYEAARLAGVRRVVFASSGVMRGYEKVPPYDAVVSGRYGEVPEDFPKIGNDVIWTDSIYGAAKVWGEALGRHYSDAYGMSIICVRLGSVNREDRPRQAREYSIYLSHRDAADFFHKCIEAPDDLKYDIVYATSNNKWGYRDLDHSREVLGYNPQDTAESFR